MKSDFRIRIDEDLHKQISELAEKNRRSIAAEYQLAVEFYLEQIKGGERRLSRIESEVTGVKEILRLILRKIGGG